MVARSVQQITPAAASAWHAAYLKMLPKIRRYAEFAFRNDSLERKADLISEVVADTLSAYVRLVQQKKEHLGYASVLARYSIARVRMGKRVGNPLRGCDVLSEYARRRHAFQVDRLDYYDQDDEAWREIVIEDKKSPPAAIACFRVDFSEWLSRLPRLRRTMALVLASGETTATAAKRFGVSSGRVSQLRLWLKQNWETFQGEPSADECARLAVA